MRPLPHRYSVSTSASPTGDIIVAGSGLPSIATDAPVDFDGPGERWSPEELLVAAVADCFALTFRGIARASRVPWGSLTCDAVGTLDRIDGITAFTHMELSVRVEVPEGVAAERIERIATRAEKTCLITRSLKATTALSVKVDVPAPPDGHLTKDLRVR